MIWAPVPQEESQDMDMDMDMEMDMDMDMDMGQLENPSVSSSGSGSDPSDKPEAADRYLFRKRLRVPMEKSGYRCSDSEDSCLR